MTFTIFTRHKTFGILIHQYKPHKYLVKDQHDNQCTVREKGQQRYKKKCKNSVIISNLIIISTHDAKAAYTL